MGHSSRHAVVYSRLHVGRGWLRSAFLLLGGVLHHLQVLLVRHPRRHVVIHSRGHVCVIHGVGRRRSTTVLGSFGRHLFQMFLVGHARWHVVSAGSPLPGSSAAAIQ